MQKDTVQKGKPWFFLPALIVFALCLYALGVWFAKQNQTEPQVVTMLFEVDGPHLDEALYEKQLATLKSLATAEVIAFNALQEVQAEQWIGPQEQFDAAVQALSKSIAMEVVPGTNLLKAHLASERNVDLNAVALAYGNALIEHVQLLNQGQYDQKIKPLHDALIAKEEEINEALRQEKQIKKDQQAAETTAKLLEKKIKLELELQQIQANPTSSPEDASNNMQANTYSHQVLLERTRDKHAQQKKALDGVSSDHPLYNTLQNALRQTEQDMIALEQHMSALQALVERNSKQSIRLAQDAQIQALKERISNLEKAMAMVPTEEAQTTANRVASDKLFKELELLENELIEQKKNGLQLTLSWFSKPTP
ncbi:MAG TPA: hypothetical protein VFV57_11590 [Limnobacter sp.]|nr:hypothetical protein [Limnobacter sp.]